MTSRCFCHLLLAGLGFFMSSAPAFAATDETGVSANAIIIGRVTPRGSPVFGGMAKQRTGSADAYIASVNAAGGVHGRKLVIKDRDDAYKSDMAAVEVRQLIEEDKVVALMGSFGTPTLPFIMREAEAAKVPLIGATMLSNEARAPVKRYVFPVRISLTEEALAVVRHQTTIGVRKFVVLRTGKPTALMGRQPMLRH